MDRHHLQIGLWNHLALCRLRNGSYVHTSVCACVFVYFLGRLFRLFTADKSALLFIKGKKKMFLPQCVCYPRIKQAGGNNLRGSTDLLCGNEGVSHSQRLFVPSSWCFTPAVLMLLLYVSCYRRWCCLYVFPICLCLPLQIVHSPAPPLSEMLAQLSCQLVTCQQEVGFGRDDAVMVVFRIYWSVLLELV